MTLRQDADFIIKRAMAAAQPDEAVAAALRGRSFEGGKLLLVAIGKAGWQMASAAVKSLSRPVDGVVITKYGHVRGELPGCRCFEAGHPVPDEGSFRATEEAISLVGGLSANDTVLFLISGGGSALFEKPLVTKEEMEDVTSQLLASGADIVEMNTIRKRLSAVKGGKFAKLCEPAKVFGIVLSDILGDPLDMIASGPAWPDSSTCEDAQRIAKKYNLRLSDRAAECLKVETPKSLDNVEMMITGSVRQLCAAAEKAAQELGYRPVFLTDCLDCEARAAGSFLGAIAKSMQKSNESLAFISGGETVVHLTGKGKGGRNQELALAAAEYLASCHDSAVFSVGSDGTDGPTDAAGGFVDETTKGKLTAKGLNAFDVLKDNDAYHALKAVDGLIVTGPTGTNVNDLSVLLVKR